MPFCVILPHYGVNWQMQITSDSRFCELQFEKIKVTEKSAYSG